MAISLGPGKFYGKSLPRPRFYTDVKFNDHRLDPPIPVTDPFMSWAQEAHWSMGGLSYTRLRYQGKIEGNVNKLRSQLEKVNKAKARAQSESPAPVRVGSKRAAAAALASSSSPFPSPPAAPVAAKRRRLMSLIEEEKKKGEVESQVVTRGVQRRRLVKKLGEEFDRVASENEAGDELGWVGSKLDLSKGLGDGSESDLVGPRIRRRRLMKNGEVVGKVVEDVKIKKMNEKKSDDEKSPSSVSGNGVRTSPRLAKRVNN